MNRKAIFGAVRAAAPAGLFDDPGNILALDNLLDVLGGGSTGLPPILVLPDLRLDGPFAQLIRAVAIGRNLPVTVTGTYRRPMLESLLDGQTYLQHAISPEHFRELRRQWRKLDRLGALSYNVARQPADIRLRMEEFLLLEASGWKGRGRTAMINDRYRAAFAREAITNLAETDGVRIHTLDLDGRAIASMVVFLTGGEASDYTAAEPLMEIPVAAPKALLADKGYDGDRFRESLLIRGILPIIPPRSNRKVPQHPDYRRYRDRNRVERMFGFLKHQRRIATRFEKTTLSYLSFLNIAAARLWLKHFVNAT